MGVFVFVKLEFEGVEPTNQWTQRVDGTLVVFEEEAFAFWFFHFINVWYLIGGLSKFFNW
jgi:hypothetical protein